MKSDILHLLEFPQKNELYSLMSKNALDILLNIELLFKNKINLDKVYHEPDNFLIECNNVIRNILFIIEKSTKSKTKYPWLYNFIQGFIKEHEDNYIILKKLRDNSMHQELIIADGAILFGLYRIINETSYELKIGMGDVNEVRSIPSHYIYSETESYFQYLLILHYYLFMNLDHSTKGECLGITRLWFYEVEYKDKSQKLIKKRLNIYNTVSTMVDSIINGISFAYSEFINIPHEKWRIHISAKYNFINTLLEIDLYPNIFKNQWDSEAKPLNWKYLLEYNMVCKTEERFEQINKIYSYIPKTKDEIITLLDRYVSIKTQDFIDQADYDKYMSFILLPHYFLNSIKTVSLINNFNFSLIMELHNLGQVYALNINPFYEKIDDKIKDSYFEKLGVIIGKIKISLSVC